MASFPFGANQNDWSSHSFHTTFSPRCNLLHWIACQTLCFIAGKFFWYIFIIFLSLCIQTFYGEQTQNPLLAPASLHLHPHHVTYDEGNLKFVWSFWSELEHCLSSSLCWGEFSPDAETLYGFAWSNCKYMCRHNGRVCDSKFAHSWSCFWPILWYLESFYWISHWASGQAR